MKRLLFLTLSIVMGLHTQIGNAMFAPTRRFVTPRTAMMINHLIKQPKNSPFAALPYQAKAFSTHTAPLSYTNWRQYIPKLIGAGLASAALIHTQNAATLGDRPPQVQAAVDQAFENNKRTQGWLYNGELGWYEILNLNDELMIKHTASHEADDIYLIDVGCAQGTWGKKAFHTLQNEEYKKTGKRFHIFSLTGGVECDELIEHKNHVTLYQFNQFKIENIDEELAKRGFNLKDKVHLIVSNWTLRHLADPFGALQRLYGLLIPTQGKLLSNGFLFAFDTSDQVEYFPIGNENILANQNSNVTILFNRYIQGRNVNEFLLVRNNKGDINIPLEYTGSISAIGGGMQCASETLTRYKKSYPFKTFPKDTTYLYWDFLADKNEDYNLLNLYCSEKDKQCKNLYAALKAQGLWPKK